MCLLGSPYMSAHAQCPPGTPPGSPMCLPPGAPGNPYTNQVPTPPVSEPTLIWKPTWGAFAEGSTKDSSGVIGTSSGLFSRGAAQRAAISKCKSLGGRDCKLVFQYQNTCAVIAEPIDLLPMMVAFFQDGPLEDATVLALSGCEKQNGGNSCKVIYKNCTEPVLVRR